MGNFSSDKLDNLSNIIHYSDDIDCLDEVLSEILEEKSIFDDVSDYYIQLASLEIAVRYRLVQLEDYSIDKTRKYLLCALNCSKSIQFCCKHLGYKLNSIEYLNSIHQEAIILYELYKFGNEPIKDLKRAITLLDQVLKNTNEVYLHDLAMFNKSNCYLELARLGVNSHENCLNAMKLTESCTEKFPQNGKEYKELMINLADSIFLLINEDNSSLGIEFYETMETLIDKYDCNELTQCYIKYRLVDLGYFSVSNLDYELNRIISFKNNYSNNERRYHELFMLEIEFLIKKTEYLDDAKGVMCLLNVVSDLEDYRELPLFDCYYYFKSLIKEAKVRIILSKLNIDKNNNLNKAVSLLLKSKDFFNNVLFQNKEHNCPLILLYMAIAKKELALINNSIKNEFKEIENIFIHALEFFERNNNKEYMIECYMELGELLFSIHDYEKAYYYLKNGIQLVELIRSYFSNFEVKKTFFKKSAKLFELMVLTCYYLGKYDESLRFLELSKHRVFLDKIVQTQRIRNISTTECFLIHEFKNIEFVIDNTLNKLKNFHLNGFKFSHDYEKLLKLRKLQDYCFNKIKRECPVYFDYYYNNFFDYTKLDLSDKTLIEYFYYTDIILIFVVEDKKVVVKKVNLKNNELLNYITNFHERINESYGAVNIPSIVDNLELILVDLYNLLFAPITNVLNNDELIIVPFKELHNIPFYCLKEGKKYVIDDYLITIVQSGSSIKFLENNAFEKINKDALVIGNPDNSLDDAESEAIFIANILNTTPLIKSSANKNNILNVIENKQIIHFAGHSYFDFENPMLSSIKLSDGTLSIHDLQNLQLNSELFVLSSCESGVVDIDESDEVDSFISYLQLDGVKYVIASLWGVYSKSSKEIFKKFYCYDDEYPIRLRLAQLDLKDNNEKVNILEWGAFQIYGV